MFNHVFPDKSVLDGEKRSSEVVLRSIQRNEKAIRLGLRRIQTWRSHKNVPVAVTATSNILEAVMLDHSSNGSETQVRLAYSMAVIRFVNGIVDPMQKKIHAVSIGYLAEQTGISQETVDVRHQATHNNLPSRAVLRGAVCDALKWLFINYWKAQRNHKPYVVSVVEASLREYKKASKAAAKEKIRRAEAAEAAKAAENAANTALADGVTPVVEGEGDADDDNEVVVDGVGVSTDAPNEPLPSTAEAAVVVAIVPTKAEAGEREVEEEKEDEYVKQSLSSLLGVVSVLDVGEALVPLLLSSDFLLKVPRAESVSPSKKNVDIVFTKLESMWGPALSLFEISYPSFALELLRSIVDLLAEPQSPPQSANANGDRKGSHKMLSSARSSSRPSSSSPSSEDLPRRWTVSVLQRWGQHLLEESSFRSLTSAESMKQFLELCLLHTCSDVKPVFECALKLEKKAGRIDPEEATRLSSVFHVHSELPSSTTAALVVGTGSHSTSTKRKSGASSGADVKLKRVKSSSSSNDSTSVINTASFHWQKPKRWTTIPLNALPSGGVNALIAPRVLVLSASGKQSLVTSSSASVGSREEKQVLVGGNEEEEGSASMQVEVDNTQSNHDRREEEEEQQHEEEEEVTNLNIDGGYPREEDVWKDQLHDDIEIDLF